MAFHSIAEIYIGDFKIPSFKSIILHQQIDNHHDLEIVARMDVLEKQTSELGNKSKQFLGETITLKITPSGDISGYGKLKFVGIVTQIKIVKGINKISGDEIVILAKSPTILTDDGPNYASHNEKSLSDIISQTFKEYDQSKLKTNVKPNFKDTILYSVQHNESCFNYTSRLAAQYGEWFYYDGAEIVFGKADTNEITLNYHIDLIEFNLSLLPLSNKYKYYTNDYLLNDTHETQTESSKSNGYNGFVSEIAKDVYNKETSIIYNPFVNEKMNNQAKKLIKQQKKAIEINQVKFTGKSNNPGISLGGIVTASEAGDGKYRVTSIIHSCNESGNYENHFEGITDSEDVYPYTNIRDFPISYPQTAVVNENNDPEKLGRIKVCFPWQKALGEVTPWIRMVSMHAGKEKGFYFIPEIGEEVLIGFEGGNAERPYVLGSLYHSDEKPLGEWSTQNNDIKTIKTRAGHTIEFNDEDGDESITIFDSKGNSILLDTKEGGITIDAPDSLTLKSKNITIKASNNLNISASNKANFKAMEITSEADTNLTFKSKAKIDLKSAMVGIKGDATAKLEGSIVDIKGTAMTNVKGGIVNLN